MAFPLVELGLVGDVAHGARLGAAAKQRALRAFEHLDALHVGHVDVGVARGELHRLIIEIDRDIREGRDGARGLVAGKAGREATHEDRALARAIAGEGHVGRIFQQVVKGCDVELREGIA